MPTATLAIKFMGGKAFRSPAPSELAGANTFTLGSNITALKPETLTTFEAAVNWMPAPHLAWNTNVFRTKFENQIAYSASNFNLSTNVYTLTTEGLETELLFGSGAWQGYLNASYARRVDETVLDTTIAPSRDITWVPARMVKAGVIWTSGRFTGSLQGSYSGQVRRRASEVGLQPIPLQGTVLDMDAYRPTAVAPYLQLNAKVSYSFGHGITASLVATNLLDKTYYLDKTLAFPFDYRGPRRNLSLVLKVDI
jgi:iron complex outermembrane receptor protein